MGKQTFNLSGVELAGKNGDKLTYSSSPPYGKNDVRHLSRMSSTFKPDWRPATRQSTSTAHTHTSKLLRQHALLHTCHITVVSRN